MRPQTLLQLVNIILFGFYARTEAQPIQSQIHRGTAEASLDFFRGFKHLNFLRRYSDMLEKAYNWTKDGGDEGGNANSQVVDGDAGGVRVAHGHDGGRDPKLVDDVGEDIHKSDGNQNAEAGALGTELTFGSEEQNHRVASTRDRETVDSHQRADSAKPAEKHVEHECVRRGLDTRACRKILPPKQSEIGTVTNHVIAGTGGALFGVVAAQVGPLIELATDLGGDGGDELRGNETPLVYERPPGSSQPHPDVMETSFNEPGPSDLQPTPSPIQTPSVAQVPGTPSSELMVEIAEPVVVAGVL